ncbi:MAG: hypothetical protein V1799_06440 [bacterium]
MLEEEEIKAQRILSAAEKNEYVVDESLIQSRQFLDRLIQLYINHKVKRNRILRLHHHIPLVVFVSDTMILRRVLGNMIKNALEASAEGETVTVGSDIDGELLEFWVHNTRIHTMKAFQNFENAFNA